MTGYLHIPDDDSMRAAIVEAAHDWAYPDCQHPTGPGWDCGRFAESLLSVLHGLSVEPTEAGICGDLSPLLWPSQPVLACRLRAGHLGWHEGDSVSVDGTPTSWTRDKPAAAAPVPVQKDQP